MLIKGGAMTKICNVCDLDWGVSISDSSNRYVCPKCSAKQRKKDEIKRKKIAAKAKRVVAIIIGLSLAELACVILFVVASEQMEILRGYKAIGGE
jgi:uncharacterized paraquat-inducible protein A